MKRSRSPASKKPSSGHLPQRRGHWLWWILPALLCALAGIAIWRPWEREADAPIAHPARPVAHSLPPVSPSPHLNTRAGAEYVGTTRCAECHSEQHTSYLHTAHSRSMRFVDPAMEPGDGVLDHTASGRRYRSYHRDGELRHSESLVSAMGEEQVLCDQSLTHLVGSGRFSRTYLFEDQGFVVESPLTWYVSLNSWRMSPGYDVRDHQAFHRTVSFNCLYCHAGRLDRSNDNDETVRLTELAIGCERCHGPGSLHAAKWTEPRTITNPGADLTIVNPIRLPRERLESVCHQCHLSGETQIAVRGRSISDFRPGLRWQDFAIDYGFESAGKDMTVVGHVAQMRQSRCYQASETLTCITCHPPHAPVDPVQRIAHYRAACLQCHAEPTCGVPIAERSSTNGNDCAECHMPQSSTDIPHIAFTHHRVGIHDAKHARQQPGMGEFRALAPILDVSKIPEIDRRRALGLAFIQYYRDHNQYSDSQFYLSAARPLIESTVTDGIIDAPLALAKAEMASANGDRSGAEDWARRALTADHLTSKERAAALRMLAGMALQADRLNLAESRLEELIELCRDPRDWFLLGVCRQRQGDFPGAIAAFERVRQIDPAQSETYDMLAELYSVRGDAELAQSRREQARSIRAAAAARN